MRRSSKHLSRSRVGFRALTIKPEIHARGEINVTPLIDVVLVLLIIFMVVTPLIEREFLVSLPSERLEKSADDLKPEQLAVHVDDAGGLAINERVVTASDYITSLRQLLEARAPAERVVFVVASDAVRYPALVEIMDGAKRAGALTVGLAIEGGARRGGP